MPAGMVRSLTECDMGETVEHRLEVLERENAELRTALRMVGAIAQEAITPPPPPDTPRAESA